MTGSRLCPPASSLAASLPLSSVDRVGDRRGRWNSKFLMRHLPALPGSPARPSPGSPACRCRVTPSGARASSTALITAGGTPIAPTSPTPLMPTGLCVQAVTWLPTLNDRQVRRARHAVAHVRARRGAARRRRRRTPRSSAWPIPCARPPCAWPSTIIGIDDHPDVVGDGDVHHLDDAGLRVDLDLDAVAAAGEGEVLGIVERRVLEPRLRRLDRIVVRHVGGEGDLAEGLLAVGAGDPVLAVRELDVGDARLEQMGGDLLALVDDLVDRLVDRRAADRRRARAVGAHAERDAVGVAVDDLDVLDRDAEPLDDELREGRLVPLAVAVRAGEHRSRCPSDGRAPSPPRRGRRRRRARRPGRTARCRTPRCRSRSRSRAACRASPTRPCAPRSLRSRSPASAMSSVAR